MAEVKVSLSYQDLVKLFESDEQAKLQLRNGVVQVFAEKNLRALINSEMLKAAQATAIEEAKKQVLASPGNWRSELSNAMKLVISAEVEKQVEARINSIIETLVSQNMSKLESIVEKRTNELLKQEVDRRLQAKIRQLAGF